MLELGKYGIWTFDFEDQSAAVVRDSVRALEEQGWPTVWIPERDGREALTHAGFLLAATERLNVVNGIAQIWSRGAAWTHGAAHLLADAYPDRHVLGLGGGGVRAGVRPLAAMTAYLDELDAQASPNPAPATPVRRILAAYGPKMLALARDRALGAHTYHVTVEHTAQAREILGDAFLGVEQAVLFETDPARARAIARAHLADYVGPGATYNLAKFRRLGFTEEDLSDGGSDRFVDELVFWGDVDSVVARLAGHVAAGADHVGVQVIGTAPGTTAVPHWQRLAEALLVAV
ncbi:putative F420-dependent oxidoreductase [Crossiella equi]|uniref:F420-dependent oxidoreductase n=1 Tax=Crossiella equi TaxID=130796 RepID=A0ABS5AP53_9PSEU|nr:TIGR03620 family F420-dependent LLM class oxidoreductase [Crossiella equi]MBP2478358.1 putative F420-dependent oxidoreductase [Crossiella equi]